MRCDASKSADRSGNVCRRCSASRWRCLRGACCARQPAQPAGRVAMPGETLAFDRSKGNCLTCHVIKGGDAPGNVGPPLSDMKARFPDRKELAAIIFDETKRNPQTVMPPFGRNLILTRSGNRIRRRFSLHAIGRRVDEGTANANANRQSPATATRRADHQGAFAGVAVGPGLAAPLARRARAADAATWPKDAFTQKTEADAIKALYGKTPKSPTRSSSTRRRSPRTARWCRSRVEHTLPDVTSIAILVSENPFPLAATYKIPPGTIADGGEPAEDGEDQQGHRAGRVRTAKCSAPAKKSKSPSAAAAAERANDKR